MQNALVCPLCKSENVRSAAVTEAVTVAQCDACGARFTIQHGALLAPSTRGQPSPRLVRA
jgi:transcription elongation factor Elf1